MPSELVVGEVLPPRMPCGPAVAFQGPRHLCVQRSGCGPPGADPANLLSGTGDISGPSAPVSRFPGHWPAGIGVRTSQGPWHLCLPVQAPLGLRVRAFGTCAPRWPRHWPCRGGRIRALGTCALSPCLLALRHGGKRVRALGTCAIHPSLNFREDDRLLVRLSVHALVGQEREMEASESCAA